MSLKAPLYGADINDTLFKPTSQNKWNFHQLDSVLSDVLSSQKLAGINIPYLYIGGLRTMFAWHTEDFHLGSINYLHTGSPKFWYCVGRKEFRKLDKWVKTRNPDAFLECSEYLRHKTTVINPYLLKEQVPDIYLEK